MRKLHNYLLVSPGQICQVEGAAAAAAAAATAAAAAAGFFLFSTTGPTLSPVSLLCWVCEPSHLGN